MIELKDVSLSFKNGFKEVTALNSVSLKVPKGQIYGILGQSGSGKSTLLRTMNGLLRPQSGQVIVNSQCLDTISKAKLNQLRQSIGFVFQEPRLLNNLTVGQNLETILEIQNSKQSLSIEDALNLVGLSDKLNAYPSSLSGGQKQRVAIARAIINLPQILLLDEPTSALDEYSMAQIVQVLKTIHQKLGITMVLVSHQIALIKAMCQQACIFDNGQVIEEVTLVQKNSHPIHLSYQEFVLEALSDEF